MPSRRRYCPVGMPVHVVQRGNNRQVCFTCDHDMAAYAECLRQAAEKYQISIHAWVFMTNHVHLLMTPLRADAISKCMQVIGRKYVRFFNQAYGRTGTLFEGRFKTSVVQASEYFLNCQRYIELNPVRAGMVSDPADYLWSSYRAHAFGQQVRMWSAHDEYLELGPCDAKRQANYRQLFSQVMDSDVLANIRSCTQRGFVLGTGKFRLEVEELTGIPQFPRKRGPRPNPAESEDVTRSQN